MSAPAAIPSPPVPVKPVASEDMVARKVRLNGLTREGRDCVDLYG